MRVAPTVNPCVLVYDVGGSHISASVCSSGDYQLGPVERAGLPESETSDAFLHLLHALGTKAANGLGCVEGAELAMPGPFDYSQGISWMRHKLPYLYGVNLSAELAARFGWQPHQVRFLNDAAAYLLGEVGAGAARGVPRVVGITLGTGVGSAFAVDGRIVVDGHGVPPGGEIWNIPYPPGIVEDLVSTRAIQSSYLERTGQEREVASIAHYATGGDEIAAEIFGEFGTHLGQVLRKLLANFAPGVVVLGGGISRSSILFMGNAKKELEGLGIQLRVSQLGDNAPLAGSGVAWFSRPKAAVKNAVPESATAL
jgi:glucokinase